MPEVTHGERSPGEARIFVSISLRYLLAYTFKENFATFFDDKDSTYVIWAKSILKRIHYPGTHFSIKFINLLLSPEVNAFPNAALCCSKI